MVEIGIMKGLLFEYRKPSSIYCLDTHKHTHRIQVQFYKYYVCRINIYFRSCNILCDMSNNVYYRMWRL